MLFYMVPIRVVFRTSDMRENATETQSCPASDCAGVPYTVRVRPVCREKVRDPTIYSDLVRHTDYIEYVVIVVHLYTQHGN